MTPYRTTRDVVRTSGRYAPRFRGYRLDVGVFNRRRSMQDLPSTTTVSTAPACAEYTRCENGSKRGIAWAPIERDDDDVRPLPGIEAIRRSSRWSARRRPASPAEHGRRRTRGIDDATLCGAPRNPSRRSCRVVVARRADRSRDRAARRGRGNFPTARRRSRASCSLRTVPDAHVGLPRMPLSSSSQLDAVRRDDVLGREDVPPARWRTGCLSVARFSSRLSLLATPRGVRERAPEPGGEVPRSCRTSPVPPCSRPAGRSAAVIRGCPLPL